MKGTVRKKGATWSYRIELGIVNNQRKQKEKSGFKTAREAKQALNIALYDLLTKGAIFDDTKITLAELFEDFLSNEASLNRKYSTILRYKSLFKNHLSDEIGNSSLFKITTRDIQELISEKADGLSDSYIKSIYNFLVILFGYAVRLKYIRNSPVDGVMPPKPNHNLGVVKVFTLDEINRIEERIASTNLLLAFRIGLYLGVRAGECYALRWSDFNFENNTVIIDKQLQSQNSKWSFATLKTRNSYRCIKFGDKFKQYLLSVKADQEEHKILFGDCYKKNLVMDVRDRKKAQTLLIEDFVNVKPDGAMLNSNSHKVITRIAKDELSIDFKFHNLRHTHATMLLEGGANPKFVQERLGHSKLDMTMRLYTHVTRAMEDQAANIIDDMLDF